MVLRVASSASGWATLSVCLLMGHTLPRAGTSSPRSSCGLARVVAQQEKDKLILHPPELQEDAWSRCVAFPMVFHFKSPFFLIFYRPFQGLIPKPGKRLFLFA